MSIEVKAIQSYSPTVQSEDNDSSDQPTLTGNILSFNVSFEVKDRKILTNAYGNVKAGECLAIMGPSGAGKTTLLSVLTLEAHGGKSSGLVTLNGQNMSNEIFRKRCSVVAQEDYHWAFLTCRETLTYACQLYQIQLNDEEVTAKVDAMLKSTGLESCADTKVGSALIKGISGGQKRRLSVAVTLLKKLDVIYLDEPTSGLDSASAASIMQFITEMTRKHSLITLTTIHQPSTAVYNGFDNVLILSKGRMAYCGKAGDAALVYFETIGYPIAHNTNPAEFMVDLVNGDFNEDSIVEEVLTSWAQNKPFVNETDEMVVSVAGHKEELEDCQLCRQISVLIRRHFVLSYRDPLLYIGRMAVFFLATLFFAVIYVKSRDVNQEQVMNRMWYTVWIIGMPSNMGVVAVYAYNQEFFAIKKESKNGMVMPAAYNISVSILQLPVMFLLGVCGISVGAYGVLAFNPDHYGQMLLVYAAAVYSFEAFAQLFSVMFANPLLGMLNFVQVWFGAFLFCGLMVPLDDVVWPLKIMGWIMPLKYALRSMIYQEFVDTDWRGAQLCSPGVNQNCLSVEGRMRTDEGWTCGDSADSQQLCWGKEGWQVLESLGSSFTFLSDDNSFMPDVLVLVAISVIVKLIHAFLLSKKCATEVKIVPA